jgi:hypothetical protein
MKVKIFECDGDFDEYSIDRYLNLGITCEISKDEYSYLKYKINNMYLSDKNTYYIMVEYEPNKVKPVEANELIKKFKKDDEKYEKSLKDRLDYNGHNT